MNRTLVIPIAVLLATCLATAANAGLGPGELTLFGAAASGDYGTGVETGAQWFTVRYVTGDDLQFRGDLSMVRVESLAGVSLTGFGPTTTGDSRRQGQRNGAAASSIEAASLGAVGSAPESVAFVEEWTAGVGDLFLAVSKRVTGGGVKLFRFDTNLEVKVPTADETRNLGTGEWDFRLGFAGEYRFWSATAYGGLGWNKLGDPAWVEFDDALDVVAGVDGDPVFGERVIIGGWIEGWQEAVRGTGHRAALGVGMLTTGKIRWRLQVKAGLTDPAPDLEVIVGVSFGLAPRGPSVKGPQL